MAALRFHFNRHRQMAETLPVLTSDNTTLFNPTIPVCWHALRPVAKLH